MLKRTHSGTQRGEFCPPLLWSQKDRIPGWKFPEEEIFACIYDEDITRLRELLALGPPPELPQHPSYHPWGSSIHLAAALGSLEAVDVLLEAGVDPNLAARNDISPAVAGGFHGVPINIAIAYGHRQVVNRLWQAIIRQPTVSWPRQSAQECLVHAARSGHADILEDLLSSKHEWSKSVHEMALRASSVHCHLQVVKVLLDRQDSAHKYSQKALDSALAGAVGFDRAFDKGPRESVPGMYFANQPATIALLIDKGANPNATRTGFQKVPLVICAAGNADCTCALKAILKHGANPNATSTEGFTALHAALGQIVYRSESSNFQDREYVWNEAAVRILLDHGASVTACNKLGIMPLHVAAELTNLRVFETLLASVNPDQSSSESILSIQTEKLESLLHFAALGGRLELMGMLLDRGLHINQKHADGWTPLLCALTPDSRPGDVTANDLTEKTLSIAVRAANFMIARGADTRVISERGWTPLSVLSLHHGFGTHSGAKKLALRLIQDQVAMNIPTPDVWDGWRRNRVMGSIDRWQKYRETPGRNQTLLHWAAEHCAYSVVEALLESGADPMARDDHGRTPAMVAAEFGVHHDPRVSWKVGFETNLDMTLVNGILGLLKAAGGGTGWEEVAPDVHPEKLCGPGAISICKTCVNIRSRELMAAREKRKEGQVGIDS
ncbi:ankyrin repeats (many copies) domain-containing protein [Sarocladium implicatum]|nr:ankyrin repeats (many copies) domain-containing protein [Sarocladium implicatum]